MSKIDPAIVATTMTGALALGLAIGGALGGGPDTFGYFMLGGFGAIFSASRWIA